MLRAHNVLVGQLEFSVVSKRGTEMPITLSKIAALCLVIVYTSISVFMAGFVAIPGMMILLVPPLGLIWFAEDLSEFTGYVGKGGTIDQSSPEFLIAAFGWLVLLGLPIYMYYSS